MSQSTMSIIMLVGIIAIMYFLLIRPQRKKEKEVQNMRNSIQAGDEVVTIGGFCGKVVKAKEESLIIQLGADRTKVEIMRWGISRIVEESARKDSDDEAEAPVKRPARPKRMKVEPVAEEPAAEETPAVTEEAPAAEEPAAEPEAPQTETAEE